MSYLPSPFIGFIYFVRCNIMVVYCSRTLLFYFASSVSVFHIATCVIFVRNGGRIIYDSPDEPFGLGRDGSSSGFGLRERALCSVTRNLQQPYPTKEETVVLQRKLMEEENWQTTSLKSYTQTYRGIPFYASSLVFSYDSSTGKYERRDIHGLKHVSEEDAERLYRSDKIAPELSLSLCKTARNESKPDIFNDFEDYYYVDEADNNKLKIVKKVRYRVSGGVDTACLVDAIHPGKVVRSWLENYKVTVSVDGVGGNTRTSKYYFGAAGSGAKYSQLQVELISSTGERMCSMQHGEIYTYPTCTATSPTQFACDSGYFNGNGESYSPANDCHYFADKFQEFITGTMQVSPWYPGTRNYVKIIVKSILDCYYIGLENCPYDNVATYFPIDNTVVMSNGCPDLTSFFYHMCSCPDVVAHELGHAVTAKYSQLEYGSGGMSHPDSYPAYTESACVNEAFSDIIGIAFEYWLESETDYLIGLSCMKGAKPIRSMINATNQLTVGYDNMNQLYSTFAESHDCAGIFNKAYYTLATTTGWDPLMAAKPFALANQCYWRHTITMREAACSVLNAATTLYTSTVTDDVTAAFAAVGIANLCVERETTVLGDCQTAAVALSSAPIGDLVNFRYNVPSSISGQPNGFLLITAMPYDFGLLWRTGDSAPNFDANENQNLLGFGNLGNQYIATVPTGTITFAMYVTRSTTGNMTINVCGSLLAVSMGLLTVSKVDGDVSSCDASVSGLSWIITRDPSFLVIKITIPPTTSIHHTYKFSMKIAGYPTSTSVTDNVRVLLYIGYNKVVTAEKQAKLYKSLSRSDNNFTVSNYILGNSTTSGVAGDYYVTLMGYVTSVSFTTATYNGISVTICDVLDAVDFDPYYFDFTELVKLPKVISAGSSVKTGKTLSTIFVLFVFLLKRA